MKKGALCAGTPARSRTKLQRLCKRLHWGRVARSCGRDQAAENVGSSRLAARGTIWYCNCSTAPSAETLGSQGGRRRNQSAIASPSVRASGFGDRASSCGNKQGTDTGICRWALFRIAGLCRPPGVLSAVISPTKISSRIGCEGRLGFSHFSGSILELSLLGILHKNGKVFRPWLGKRVQATA